MAAGFLLLSLKYAGVIISYRYGIFGDMVDKVKLGIAHIEELFARGR